MLSTPGISVIVMAYNEEPLVRDTLRMTAEALALIPGHHEIVFVDDGSEDRSHAIATETAPTLPVPMRVLRHEHNLGSGAAKRTGFEAAAGDLVIAIPCDNPLTGTELAGFAGAARVADIVCGYRLERPGYTRRMLWGSRLYRYLIRALFGVKVRDAGWIKMFRRVLHPWLAVESDGVFNHVEMLTKARCMGLTLAEVPCPMRRREHGVPTIARPRVIAGTLAQTILHWFRLKVLGRRPEKPPHELLALARLRSPEAEPAARS
jgi:glycosyltransferase involved in cell wall biosynthesis